MKRIAFLLLFSSLGLAQTGIRIGDPGGPLQTTAVISGVTVLTPIQASSIQLCSHPANAVPCTNKATTYTDATLGTPCSTSTQVVLDGTASCVATSDALGNWGVWVSSANYDWTWCNSSGACFGPYYVTANSSPNTNQWSAILPPISNVTVPMGSDTTVFNWNGGSAGLPIFSLISNNLTAVHNFALLGSGEVVIGNGTGFPSPLAVTGLVLDSPTPVQNKTVCIGGSFTGGAILCPTGAPSGALAGICAENCNIGSEANPLTIAVIGIASCVFDNATTAGHWVIMSTTISGDCHDSLTFNVPATSISTIGRVLSSNASPGTYSVLLQISR